MTLPKPTPGLVIRYSYLWKDECLRGQTEGVKDRPCAIIVTVVDADEETVVVLPVTHSRPKQLDDAMPIPHAVKQRLGLDGEDSWIILSEANRFVWPGPDLRFLRSNDAKTVAFGHLPYAFFEKVRQKFLLALKNRRIATVKRDD